MATPNGVTAPPPKVRSRRLELPLSSNPYWDRESQVNSALLALERGLFQSPAQLVDASLRDDRANGVLHTRLNGLLGTPLKFRPARDTKEAKKIAAATEEAWPQIFPASELCELHRWGLLLNLGVAQLLWSNDAGLWMPRIQTWHPQYAYWDWHHRIYRMATQDAGVVDLPKVDEQVNGDGHWVVYTPYGYHGWMRAPIRALAKLVLMRGWTYRDYCRYNELRGCGIIKAIVPAQSNAAERDGYFNDLKNLGGDPVLETVRDETTGELIWDVDIIEAEANTYEGFEKFLGKVETSISVLLLGHNTTSEISQGGSYAAANVGNTIRGDIRQFDGRTIALTAHQQVLFHFTRFNFGDGRLAAIPEYETTAEGVDQAAANALKTLASALVQLQTARAPIDVRAMLQQYNVPMLSADAELPPVPAGVESAPPAPGSSPGPSDKKAAQLELRLAALEERFGQGA